MNTESQISKTAVCFSTNCVTANVIQDAVQLSKQSNELRKKGVYLTTTDFLKIGLLCLKSTSANEIEKLVLIARDDEKFRSAISSMTGVKK